LPPSLTLSLSRHVRAVGRGGMATDRRAVTPRERRGGDAAPRCCCPAVREPGGDNTELLPGPQPTTHNPQPKIHSRGHSHRYDHPYGGHRHGKAAASSTHTNTQTHTAIIHTLRIYYMQIYK